MALTIDEVAKLKIGDRIKFIRQKSQKNQREFASEFGLSQSHMSNIEKNVDNPSLTLIKFICLKYNTTEDWLICGMGDYDASVQRPQRQDTVRLKVALLELENNLKKWGTDATWYYSNAVEALSSILALYEPDSECKEDYSAQIQYFELIEKILMRLLFIVTHKKSISRDMRKGEIYKIVSHQDRLMKQIENLLIELQHNTFKVHGIELNDYINTENE